MSDSNRKTWVLHVYCYQTYSKWFITIKSIKRQLHSDDTSKLLGWGHRLEQSLFCWKISGEELNSLEWWLVSMICKATNHPCGSQLAASPLTTHTSRLQSHLVAFFIAFFPMEIWEKETALSLLRTPRSAMFRCSHGV